MKCFEVFIYTALHFCSKCRKLSILHFQWWGNVLSHRTKESLGVSPSNQQLQSFPGGCHVQWGLTATQPNWTSNLSLHQNCLGSGSWLVSTPRISSKVAPKSASLTSSPGMLMLTVQALHLKNDWTIRKTNALKWGKEKNHHKFS